MVLPSPPHNAVSLAGCKRKNRGYLMESCHSKRCSRKPCKDKCLLGWDAGRRGTVGLYALSHELIYCY